jgi:hypothetical protein
MIFPISYGHSVVYPSINDFLLPLWYLQTFLTNLCTVPCRINAAIVRDHQLYHIDYTSQRAGSNSQLLPLPAHTAQGDGPEQLQHLFDTGLYRD